jgi:hypothetical protein
MVVACGLSQYNYLKEGLYGFSFIFFSFCPVEQQDMIKMGSLILFLAFPFFTGFYSKDLYILYQDIYRQFGLHFCQQFIIMTFNVKTLLSLKIPPFYRNN